MDASPDERREPEASGSRRLMVLLAAAMFVLVVDTSLMNVSISAVITDLDTTASGVQSAIALEALVSAAFILINSKVGDLIGRKRAYVLGLLAYAIGALAMTLAQSLTAIVIFWAIIGGLGASLLLPAMQSLIHGNFAGAAQKQAYALVGAAAAIAAAVGPLLGGFVTTYLSWRVGFGLEVVIIAVVLAQIGLVRDVPYTGSRQVDVGRRDAVRRRHGRRRARHPGLAGGRRVRRRAHGGRRRRAGAARALAGPAQARGQGHPARSGPVPAAGLHGRGHRPDAAADHPGRRHDRAPAVLPDDARVQRAGGRPVARAAVADDVRRGDGGRPEGRGPTPGRRSSAPASCWSPSGSRSSSRSSPARTAAGTSRSRSPSRAAGWGCWCRSSTTTRSRPSRRSGSARPRA